MIPTREGRHPAGPPRLPGRPRRGFPQGRLWQRGSAGEPPRWSPTPTQAFQRFRGALGRGVVVCKPGAAKPRGWWSRPTATSDRLPAWSTLSSPADFNDQLASWLPGANDRVHSTLRCRPSDHIDEHRAAMMAPRPMLPDPAWGEIRRLPGTTPPRTPAMPATGWLSPPPGSGWPAPATRPRPGTSAGRAHPAGPGAAARHRRGALHRLRGGGGPTCSSSWSPPATGAPAQWRPKVLSLSSATTRGRPRWPAARRCRCGPRAAGGYGGTHDRPGRPR